MPPAARNARLVLPSALFALLAGATALIPPSQAVEPSAKRVAKPIARTKCSEFPTDNYWHADISALPLHARSENWLSHMSTDRDLHPDFGPSYGDGPNYGIPITVVTVSYTHLTLPTKRIV